MKISVYSFSYRCGLPVDATGNGGGFVFDCRGLPNPFWDKKLRKFTGRDAQVVEFFRAHKGAVEDFLAPVLSLVRQTIQAYQQDGRENLYIAFGCTGGQHRSVYIAEEFVKRARTLPECEFSIAHAAEAHWSL